MYAESLSANGPNLAGLGWPNAADLARRFKSLLRPLRLSNEPADAKIKLLDIGCGFGLLLDYLKENDLLDRIDYLGVDVLDKTLTEARARWPGQRFELRDVRDQPFGADSFDYCIICGVFQGRYGLSFNEMQTLAQDTLRALWPSVRVGLCFTAMSKLVDRERDDLFHWPLDDISLLKAILSRHVALHVDYGLWETTALVFKVPRGQLRKTPAAWTVGTD